MPESTAEQLLALLKFNVREITRDLPAGVGFALLMFPCGPYSEKSIVMACNVDKDDAAGLFAALAESYYEGRRVATEDGEGPP